MRFRVTAVAIVVLSLMLVLGGVMLVAFQRGSLTATIDQGLVQRADDLAALIANDADIVGMFPAGAGDGFAQLVSGDDSVLASTPNLSGSAPLPVSLPGGSLDLVRTVSDLPGDDDPYRVLTRPLAGAGYLHVGTEYEVVADAAEALAGILAVVLPVLILASGGLIWWLVGKTLTPVERIRAEVAEVESRELHRRVPEPGTGDEIDRLAQTMNEMLARLESSVERQQRFVADASHELRSPLTRIRSALEVERLGGGPRPGDRDDEALLGDVLEMQRLVDDLLYLARVDEGRAEPSFQPLDLDDLVVSEAHRIRADDRIVFDLQGVSGAHVNGDPIQLRRTVRNLFENAQRHAVRQVTVSLREEGGEAVLIVADDGRGISESDADRVFERFTRLDDSRTSGTGGSGLGLAIARHIARAHGGRLRLISSGSPGATFELRLPVAE